MPLSGINVAALTAGPNDLVTLILGLLEKSPEGRFGWQQVLVFVDDLIWTVLPPVSLSLSSHTQIHAARHELLRC